MKRFSRHIAAVVTLAFTVATVGVPVAMYYCTMQGAYRTGSCCCACPDQSATHGERVAARACIEQSDLGSPIKAAFTHSIVKQVSPLSHLCAVLPVNTELRSSSIRFASSAPRCDATPPPLLRTSVLLI